MAAPPTSVRTIVDGSGAGSIGSEVPSRWIATKPFSKNRNSRNRMRLTEERLNISECGRYATRERQRQRAGLNGNRIRCGRYHRNH